MNDDPRAALVQRLMQVQQTGDPRHVLEPAAQHAAELLAGQTVLDVVALRMDGAHLAYLSACGTARSSFRLLDESIHLTSAFQLAGFTHVVGTLWPIADDVAARFANDTYREISDRPNDVARALHEATRKVRDAYPRNPRLWAAHVHVGP